MTQFVFFSIFYDSRLMSCCSGFFILAGTSCRFLKCSNQSSCKMGGICFFSNVSGIDFRVLQKDDESVISAAFSSSLRFSSLYLFCLDLINN